MTQAWHYAIVGRSEGCTQFIHLWFWVWIIHWSKKEMTVYLHFFSFGVLYIHPAHFRFRRALQHLSTSPEAFHFLRCEMLTSHAVLCICHYLLGIGDRHLSNFMVNRRTGHMVGIDFGHAFGSATQVCANYLLFQLNFGSPDFYEFWVVFSLKLQ